MGVAFTRPARTESRKYPCFPPRQNAQLSWVTGIGL